MRLGEFRRMCEHRWNCNQADLISLDLTDASYDELWTDMILDPESPCLYKFYPGVLQNPITRMRVRVSPGAVQDSAHFHRAGSRCECRNLDEMPVFMRRGNPDD
jgi:hypothetical protein